MSEIGKVLVTGASRGIGRAIAERFAMESCELVLVCRKNEELLKQQASEYEIKYGCRVSVYAGDVADSSFIKRIFEEEKNIEIVVNNAGISYVGLLMDMSDEDYRKVMGTNLDSVFYVCREAAGTMLEKHSGRIINITSVWGEVGASMEAVYSASKAGIIGLTKALAKELAPNGISVNAISCGVIDTDMNKCFSPEDMEELVAEIPADRIGKPEEVAQLCYSLATAPDYMTGQVVRIDGGWI